MDIKTFTFPLTTKGKTDLTDITNHVTTIIKDSGFTEGSALIFVAGSTAGITTIEYEPGLIKDYPQFFENIIPSNISYEHDKTWGDENGYSHIRASLQGASLTIPFTSSRPILGTWQQIIFIEFDHRPRNRNVIVQLTGK